VSLWTRAKLCLIDNPRGSMMVGLYRLAHQASVKKRGLSGFNLIWAVPVLLGYKYLTELVLGYEIPAATKIGQGFRIHHGYGIVINKHAIFGKNVDIRHGVTVGRRGVGREFRDYRRHYDRPGRENRRRCCSDQGCAASGGHDRKSSQTDTLIL
jgi:serine acetyltransferase